MSRWNEAREVRRARTLIYGEVNELFRWGWACNQGYQETPENKARRRIARQFVKAALAAVKTHVVKGVR